MSSWNYGTEFNLNLGTKKNKFGDIFIIAGILSVLMAFNLIAESVYTVQYGWTSFNMESRIWNESLTSVCDHDGMRKCSIMVLQYKLRKMNKI